MPQNHLKTSSSSEKGKDAYNFRSIIRADWQLPVNPELGSSLQPNLAGGMAEYVILAEPGIVTASPAHWRTPPHRVFLNLPASSTPEMETEIVDPKAMLAFSKRYGLLSHETANNRWALRVESSSSLGYISSMIGHFGPEEFRELMGMKSQALLKYMWNSGDQQAIEEIASQTAKNLQPQIDVSTGATVIKVANVWTLICMLLLRDRAAGKTAICANPDCPAPYFLKSRKTQKICEAGECVAWAQRNYALNWWRKNESKAARRKGKHNDL